MDYKILNYRDDPRPMDTFLLLGEIHVKDKKYFVVHDPLDKENYIREFIPLAGSGKDGLKKGNILASIDDEKFWFQLFLIAKKEGVLKEVKEVSKSDKN